MVVGGGGGGGRAERDERGHRGVREAPAGRPALPSIILHIIDLSRRRACKNGGLCNGEIELFIRLCESFPSPPFFFHQFLILPHLFHNFLVRINHLYHCTCSSLSPLDVFIIFIILSFFHNNGGGSRANKAYTKSLRVQAKGVTKSPRCSLLESV